MADIETKIEAEAEEFTEELSDEALDREGVLRACCCCTRRSIEMEMGQRAD